MTQELRDSIFRAFFTYRRFDACDLAVKLNRDVSTAQMIKILLELEREGALRRVSDQPGGGLIPLHESQVVYELAP